MTNILDKGSIVYPSRISVPPPVKSSSNSKNITKNITNNKCKWYIFILSILSIIGISGLIFIFISITKKVDIKYLNSLINNLKSIGDNGFYFINENEKNKTDKLINGDSIIIDELEYQLLPSSYLNNLQKISLDDYTVINNLKYDPCMIKMEMNLTGCNSKIFNNNNMVIQTSNCNIFYNPDNTICFKSDNLWNIYDPFLNIKKIDENYMCDNYDDYLYQEWNNGSLINKPNLSDSWDGPLIYDSGFGNYRLKKIDENYKLIYINE